MFHEFPKWVYHLAEPARVIVTIEEELALGEGWFGSPGEALHAGIDLERKIEPQKKKAK